MRVLAIDLGAGSGRAMLGRFDGERIGLEELHRFPAATRTLPDGLRWDVAALRTEIERALALAVARGERLDAVAVDTWGVDYGLLDERGELLDLPFHYRDGRTAGLIEEATRRVPGPAWWYARTGCQTIQINTAFQLLADERAGRLDRARHMLLLPNLFSYWLTGEIAAEQTIASTTQLYDPVARDWAGDVIVALGLPGPIFPPVVAPGMLLGRMTDEVTARTGAPAGLPVVLCGSHDTASAFAAVAAEPGTLLISSGTWSLAGVERPAPILTEAARAANFTNEGGVGGTTRFLRNAAGLWLVQECRRAWAAQGKPGTYEELTAAADASPPFGPIVDPDDLRFIEPGDMPSRIRTACLESGQPAPENEGRVVRCVLESLALRYRWLAARIGELTGEPVRSIRIVGGGSRNALLCRLTAEATGLPVIAGPAEATALGNAMTQVLALGGVASLAHAREVIARSVAPVVHEPRGDRAGWDDHYARFLALGA